MEKEVKDLEKDSHTGEVITIDEVLRLSDEILKDCQLKKGKKAKFIKHIERVNQVFA
jgi:hypothetical protein